MLANGALVLVLIRFLLLLLHHHSLYCYGSLPTLLPFLLLVCVTFLPVKLSL